MNVARRGVAAAALVGCNLAVFVRHYAGEATFPWDFTLTYLAVPFYWLANIRAGLWPSWVAPQGFGYPLAANLQSGLFYPPYWLFAVVGAPLSCHAATVVSCLHVLCGGIAMAWLLHRKTRSLAVAVIAGVAFQLLGPSFGNAQHTDIVHGYALCPWLWLAADDVSENGLPGGLALVLLPAVMFLFITGAYPGQWIGATFLAGAAVSARAAVRVKRAPPGLRRAEVTGGAAFLGLIALGVLGAAVLLVPGALLRSEIARSQDHATLVHESLSLPHLTTLVFPYDAAWLTRDLSMRTLFVPFAVLAGILWMTREDLKTAGFELVFGVLGTILAFDNPVAAVITRVIPPLGLSRFPSSDYRGWITAALTLLGSLGLARLLRAGRSRGLVDVFRYAAILGLFAWAAEVAQWQTLSVERVGHIGAAVAFSLVALSLAARSSVPRWVAVVVLCAAVFLDGYRASQALRRPWDAVLINRDAEQDQLAATAAARAELEGRPARVVAEESLEGYWRGQFVNGDYASGDQLRATRAIRESPVLSEFFSRAGQGWLVAGSDQALASLVPPRGDAATVRSVSFAPSRIRYAVESTEPAILIENEPSYVGWSAVRVGNEGAPLEPVAAAWPARAWRVPAGSFLVDVTYRTPGAVLGTAVSLGALALWVLLLVLRRRRPLVAATP